jgi:hypothetical protein
MVENGTPHVIVTVDDNDNDNEQPDAVSAGVRRAGT